MHSQVLSTIMHQHPAKAYGKVGGKVDSCLGPTSQHRTVTPLQVQGGTAAPNDGAERAQAIPLRARVTMGNRYKAFI